MARPSVMLCVKSALYNIHISIVFTPEQTISSQEMRQGGYAHQVQITSQLHTSINLLLLLHNLQLRPCIRTSSLPLPRARTLRRRFLKRTPLPSRLHDLHLRMSMSVIMTVSLSPRRNPQPFIHSHESHKANHNRYSKQ